MILESMYNTQRKKEKKRSVDRPAHLAGSGPVLKRTAWARDVDARSGRVGASAWNARAITRRTSACGVRWASEHGRGVSGRAMSEHGRGVSRRAMRAPRSTRASMQAHGLGQAGAGDREDVFHAFLTLSLSIFHCPRRFTGFLCDLDRPIAWSNGWNEFEEV